VLASFWLLTWVHVSDGWLADRQDDPLSAVDAHVASHIFKRCIQHALVDKTRLLVTHQLHLLNHADWIICMDGGEIVEQGTFDELVKMDGMVATMINEAKHPTEAQTADQGQRGQEEMGHDKEGGKEMPEQMADTHDGSTASEERVVGGVSLGVYLSYLKAAGGVMVAMVVVVLLVGKEMSRVG
jgi:ATP-binding cassette, subfamily C (CFTR/MRP), member 1